MVERLDGRLIYTFIDNTQLRNLQEQQSEIRQTQKEFNKKNDELSDIVEENNDAIERMKVKRYYDVEDELRWVIVSVLKPETNKIIRQIPPEVVVDIAKYLREYTSNNIDILI